MLPPSRSCKQVEVPNNPRISNQVATVATSSEVDKIFPYNKIILGGVYLPGCPPKPEAIIDAVIKLRKKLAQEHLVQENHKNKLIDSIVKVLHDSGISDQVAAVTTSSGGSQQPEEKYPSCRCCNIQ
jgi:coenzyme F420-reducing hydrogenase gamma subunit